MVVAAVVVVVAGVVDAADAVVDGVVVVVSAAFAVPRGAGNLRAIVSKVALGR